MCVCQLGLKDKCQILQVGLRLSIHLAEHIGVNSLNVVYLTRKIYFKLHNLGLSAAAGTKLRGLEELGDSLLGLQLVHNYLRIQTLNIISFLKILMLAGHYSIVHNICL